MTEEADAGRAGPAPDAPGAEALPLDAGVGGTPLIPLRAPAPERDDVEIGVKLEARNPGGSVKDRAARAIIRAAEEEGRLGPGKVLLDASSGNTGIAYAMLCAERGYGCEICMPENASEERKKLLASYGATVMLTDAAEGSDGAVREARRRAGAEPERFLYADQYGNPANPRAHLETTGPEIWEGTAGRVTHFVAGLGTTGTFVGTGRYLRERNPDVRLVALQPASPMHGIEGWKHLPTAIVPEIWDPELPDRIVEVRTEDAQATTRRLATEAGILAGVSGGAAVAGALRVAEEAPPGSLVVTILPDGGERYLSEGWWEASR